MGKLTDRTQATGVTLNNSVIHVVNTDDTTQNPSGSSYKTNLAQILSLSPRVTEGVYNTLTESIDFSGTSLFTPFSVDLSGLETNVNYANVVFVDVVNGSDATAEINDFTKPASTVAQGVSLATALSGLSSDNRALVYIRRGNYVDPVLFLQNNVDVYCEPGVVFTGIVRITDNNVSVNSNIYGKLKINSIGSTVPFTINGGSFIYFEFDSIISNAAAIFIDITSTNNNIRIKGNSISTNTLGYGFGITIRREANVMLNISEKIESIHQTLRFRFYNGKTTINCPNIFLISGNIYGGNFKQVIYLDSPLSTGEVVINGNLVCTDIINYGGISSVVRFWESPNTTLKVNGDIVSNSISGVVLSNGAGKMVLNGNISANGTCISSGGSNKLMINNSVILRETDTFAPPFSIGDNSEVFVNNTLYYSAFYGDLININNSNAKLYLTNFTAEGFTPPIGEVWTINLTNGGTGYTTDDNVTVTGGTGNGLLIDIEADINGVVTGTTISDGGTGYSIGDILTIISGNNDAQIRVNTISDVGTFLNVNTTIPTIGLNNVATNRSYDNSIATSYLINLTENPNIITPKFF